MDSLASVVPAGSLYLAEEIETVVESVHKGLRLVSLAVMQMIRGDDGEQVNAAYVVYLVSFAEPEMASAGAGESVCPGS